MRRVLTRWALDVIGVAPSQIAPNQLHAVVCRLLDTEHHAQAKPWSVSMPTDSPTADSRIEVGAVTADLGDRLARAGGSTPLRFGSMPARLAHAPTLLDALELVPAPNAGSPMRWRVDYLTPTVLSRGKSFSPWLAGAPLMRSLRGRWNSLHPESPSPLRRASDFAVVEAVDMTGGTVPVSLGPARCLEGFVGTIWYEVRDQSAAGAVDTLMRWANFAGVGARTTRGLGVVQTFAADRETPGPVERPRVA